MGRWSQNLSRGIENYELLILDCSNELLVSTL